MSLYHRPIILYWPSPFSVFSHHRKKNNNVLTEAPVRGKTGSSEGASARFAGRLPNMVKLWMIFSFHFPSENHGKMMLLDSAPPFLSGLEFILWHMRFHELMLIYFDHANASRLLQEPKTKSKPAKMYAHKSRGGRKNQNLDSYYNIEMHHVREVTWIPTWSQLDPIFGINVFLLIVFEVGACRKHIHLW